MQMFFVLYPYVLRSIFYFLFGIGMIGFFERHKIVDFCISLVLNGSHVPAVGVSFCMLHRGKHTQGCSAYNKVHVTCTMLHVTF